VLAREDPLDAIVLPANAAARPLVDIERALGREPRIGTSSIRRVAQLARRFPAASFLPVRGNLGTRLRKLDAGEYDALVLASAGLRRLGRTDRITATIPVEVCMPAPGQGIIAVETREHDTRVRQAVALIDDADAAAALRAERAVVTRLGGGCQMPIGALAVMHGGQLAVRGLVISPDSTRMAEGSCEGTPAEADRLGREVADQLLRRGAGDILADVQRTQAAVEGIQP
jgi:hydroxymethylbilane synthase